MANAFAKSINIQGNIPLSKMCAGKIGPKVGLVLTWRGVLQEECLQLLLISNSRI